MNTLFVMRLADMVRVHPWQDDSRNCARCNHVVGIYPSGQAVLAAEPMTEIICNVCAEQEPTMLNILAPGADRELFESVKKENR